MTIEQTKAEARRKKSKDAQARKRRKQADKQKARMIREMSKK